MQLRREPSLNLLEPSSTELSQPNPSRKYHHDPPIFIPITHYHPSPQSSIKISNIKSTKSITLKNVRTSPPPHGAIWEHRSRNCEGEGPSPPPRNLTSHQLLSSGLSNPPEPARNILYPPRTPPPACFFIPTATAPHIP